MLRFVMQGHVERMADSVETARGRSPGPILSPHKAKGIYRKLEEVMDAYVHSAQEKAIAMAMAGVS